MKALSIGMIVCGIGLSACAARPQPVTPTSLPPVEHTMPQHPYRGTVTPSQMQAMLVKLANNLAGSTRLDDATIAKVALAFGLDISDGRSDLSKPRYAWQGLSPDGLYWISVVYARPPSQRKTLTIAWQNQSTRDPNTPCPTTDDSSQVLTPLGWEYYNYNMYTAPFYARKDTANDGVMLLLTDRLKSRGLPHYCISDVRISQPPAFDLPPGAVI